MGYTMLRNLAEKNTYTQFSIEEASLTFIRKYCEGLRFDQKIAEKEDAEKRIFFGTGLKENEIPYNMQMDTDRLCFENAIERFLKSGKKEDAYDMYFCYLEMFVGDYDKARRMIELLSEYEANGSRLLMKHRDHYTHSAYVFVLGLAIYESNSIYREKYNTYYKLTDEHEASCHYLQYWGLTSLFHDIGYPFELPFEQIASYFEVAGDKREGRPFVAYHILDPFIELDQASIQALASFYPELSFHTTNELFAHVLYEKLGNVYSFTEEQMLQNIMNKPTKPDEFGYYMDHAYFSASVLFKKLFGELECELKKEHLDSLTAILMHNSLYKYCIAYYKSDKNIPFQAELHPLAYMLMLCDELQCWDRTAYGRNTKNELHPMDCTFNFEGDAIKATYLFDEKEITKINSFKDAYIDWLSNKQEKVPELKAYSQMYIKDSDGITAFQQDIERIVNLNEIKLRIETGLCASMHAQNKNYLSDSNFISLYNFALILNGRWDNADWKKAKAEGQEEKFLSNENAKKGFADSFKKLSLEYKLSNINQAKAFARYMDVIGCFYTNKVVAYEVVDAFSAEDLLKIGILEHKRWLQERYDMGWEYGNPAEADREFTRQHKDMIPDINLHPVAVLGESPEVDLHPVAVSEEQAKVNYERLDKAEQDKDTEPTECMLSMLKMFDGLRIYRL